VEAGSLQADAVNLDELRQMVRTADRTTPRGKQTAVTLLLDWWMAGRASEPARLNLHDVKVITAKIEDRMGKQVPPQALVIKIRRSKADQQARGQEVRILAQDDQEICPVHAVLEWLVLCSGRIGSPGCVPEPKHASCRLVLQQRIVF
jgi:hypothetical protein